MEGLAEGSVQRETRSRIRLANTLFRTLFPSTTLGYEMKITPQGQVYFLHVQSNTSTWYDPRVPRELMNRQDINLDDLVGRLPPGWEIRTTGNRPYYVNHNNRTTQFTDPRLVANVAMLQNILR